MYIATIEKKNLIKENFIDSLYDIATNLNIKVRINIEEIYTAIEYFTFNRNTLKIVLKDEIITFSRG